MTRSTRNKHLSSLGKVFFRSDKCIFVAKKCKGACYGGPGEGPGRRGEAARTLSASARAAPVASPMLVGNGLSSYRHRNRKESQAYLFLRVLSSFSTNLSDIGMNILVYVTNVTNTIVTNAIVIIRILELGG